MSVSIIGASPLVYIYKHKKLLLSLKIKINPTSQYLSTNFNAVNGCPWVSTFRTDDFCVFCMSKIVMNAEADPEGGEGGSSPGQILNSLNF